MNLTYDYYLLTHSDYDYPSWVKSEHYFNCEHFVKLFSFFKTRS